MKGTFTITIDTTQDDAISVKCDPDFESLSEAEFILMLADMCDSIELSETGRRVAADFILCWPDYSDSKIAKTGYLIGGVTDG